ncbi:hypothetical protein QCN29_27140 [Streptomyces sp. HNM0663]|uniref:Uncharacterized protein n=1 Tax=Streptomyces chengmaiensis TaxID=3040919 RepID=A0ABT6HVM8_9ACTN|nr:hypothetical protein [Streptomyces chengmaiensis]MDH2392386.1 hypothetical protein [Streptomyces chengmaiensis]
MDLSLSASEFRLLRHLALADMPYSDEETTPAAVRGLDDEKMQDDVRSLAWRGMVAADGSNLSLTPLGAAAHYAAEVELLSARLVDVSALADRLERLAPSLAREMHAVRQVTAGAWSLEEARRYVSDKDGTDAD